MTALITLSHGSRKPGAAAGIERLTQATGVRPARAAHLEFNRPDLTTAALELAQLGETDAIVVPLLFTQGYHSALTSHARLPTPPKRPTFPFISPQDLAPARMSLACSRPVPGRAIPM